MPSFFKALFFSVAFGAITVTTAGASTVNMTVPLNSTSSDNDGRRAWGAIGNFVLNGFHRTQEAGMDQLPSVTLAGWVTRYVVFCLEPLEHLRFAPTVKLGTAYGFLLKPSAWTQQQFSFVTTKKVPSVGLIQLATLQVPGSGGGGWGLPTPLTPIGGGGGVGGGGPVRSGPGVTGGGGGSPIIPPTETPEGSDPTGGGTDPLPSPVPLPAGGWALVAALGGLSLLRRRTFL